MPEDRVALPFWGAVPCGGCGGAFEREGLATGETLWGRIITPSLGASPPRKLCGILMDVRAMGKIITGRFPS